MSAKLGRNDPCHCGSGKKYKKCHWAEDEKERAAEAKATRAVEEGDPRTMAEMIRELPKAFKGDLRREMEMNMAESAPLVEFIERSREIEAAANDLEQHWDEYSRLLDDEDAFSKRAQLLMDEPPFSELRFSAEEVREALGRIGFSGFDGESGDLFKQFEPALLRLATERRRNEIGARMMLELPRLLREGKFVEGIMVHVFASEVLEFVDESTSTLRCMFIRGLDDIAKEDQALEEAAERLLDRDMEEMAAMPDAEIEALLQERKVTWDDLPGLRELLRERKEMQAWDREDQLLAERWYSFLSQKPEASLLFLGADEVSPYLQDFLQDFQSYWDAHPSLAQDSATEEDQAGLAEALMDSSLEICHAIFDETRLDQFQQQAREVAGQFDREGKGADAELIRTIIAEIDEDIELALDRHLTALTFFSLKRSLAAVRERPEN